MFLVVLTCTNCFLVSVTVCGAVALGDYSEAGFIVFLFTTAEWLETLASHKVSSPTVLLFEKDVRLFNFY
jgi:cation transport ATPase